MQEAAAKALRHLGDRSREAMKEDEKLTLALTYLVQIIGEAANHVSEETKALVPEIRWRSIRGMRNVLAHAYFDINLEVLWETVHHELPSLHREVTKLLDAAEP